MRQQLNYANQFVLDLHGRMMQHLSIQSTHHSY